MDQEPGPDNINSLKITKAKINPNSEVLEDDVEGNPNGFCLHVRYPTSFCIFRINTTSPIDK